MSRKKRKKINYVRLICALIIVALIVGGGVFGINKFVKKEKNDMIENLSEIKTSTQEPKKEIPKDITINMVAIGDIMCHNTNFQTVYDQATKTYDFSPAFEDVAKYIEKGDIAIGNLETTFTGAEVGYSGYPTFNTPESLGDALKDIGIDVVSTANNHCMDKGSKGIINTLDNLDRIGISHTGTSRSKEEQDTILVKDVNGMKIAFLSFTYGTNGINCKPYISIHGRSSWRQPSRVKSL